MICSSVSLILAARAGDVGDELAALALQPRLVALELHEAGDADEVLLVEVGDADELLGDELDLVFLGLLLRRQAADLLVALRDPLAQLGALSGTGGLRRDSNSFSSPVTRASRPWLRSVRATSSSGR